MSRRIDIELTSVREDGTWTWRAAGAKQPRGVVDSSVLSIDQVVARIVTRVREVAAELAAR